MQFIIPLLVEIYTTDKQTKKNITFVSILVYTGTNVLKNHEYPTINL